MFGSVILDVAVGLVLVYLLLSLIATSIREWGSSILKTRSSTLHQGITELLGDAKLVEDLYNHPHIVSLYRGDSFQEAKDSRKLPAYIPARSFSTALIDLVVRGRDVASALQAGPEARKITIDSIRAQITRIGNVRVQRALLSAVDTANGDINAVYTNVEHWFDSTMDRVSGWYKHRTQVWLFGIGLILTVVADADTLQLAHRLYSDPVLRQVSVSVAGNLKASDNAGSVKTEAEKAATEKQSDVTGRKAASLLDSLGVSLFGWQKAGLDFSGHFSESVEKVLKRTSDAWAGWLMTALAISIGAPFWFDTLGRIMVVRGTVKPTQKSPNEASDDRQSGGGDPPAPASSPVVQLRPAVVPSASQLTVPTPPPPQSDFQPQEWAAGHPDGGVL